VGKLSVGFVLVSTIALVAFLAFASTRAGHIHVAQKPHHFMHGFKTHVDALLKNIGLP